MNSNDTSIKLSEFATMSEEERKHRVDALFQSAINPTPAQLKFQWDVLNEEINFFEKEYGMSSAEMMETRRTKKLLDLNSWTIDDWVMAVKDREKFKKYYSPK